ncbi:MAG TPA: NAD(P)/FAD-dependent oxidoreductase [Gemmatirosa sp.]
MPADPRANTPRAGTASEDRPHVGVVGGGILGLTLALRLREQGHRVTVLEAAPDIGGLAAAQVLDGWACDRFYHVVLPADTALQALLAELGIADRLRWRTTRTGFYTEGRLRSMSSALDFLTFPPLGPIDKLRLGYTVLYASRVRDWRRLEAIPVADWLRRLSGRRTFERIWLPLLRSKLGENYRETSATFIWATIARLYGAREAGAKRERFGWIDGGYAGVLARFAEHLDARGVTVRCGAAVAEVCDRAADDGPGGGVDVRLATGERLHFDAVALTVPTGRIAAMAPQLTAAERERLRGVTYQGIVCVTALLRRPPAGGYYVTNITDAGLPFTAVIDMTALVDPARVGGHALVYLPRYAAQDDPIWQQSDAEVVRAFLDGLARVHPHVGPDDVLDVRVARAREVLALTTLHYSERWLPPVETSLPGVFVVTSAQIAAGTLNVNETLQVAAAGAAAIGRSLGASRPMAVC